MRLHTYLVAVSLMGILGCAQPSQHLNSVFIIVDDLNVSLGSYGHPQVRSPNIDRLAALGVRFDRSYAQGPMCNPSRTSMLSGRYPETTQVLANRQHSRQALGKVLFLPEHFRAHGYHTARGGKVAHFKKTVSWGEPGPADRWFRPFLAGRPLGGTPEPGSEQAPREAGEEAENEEDRSPGRPIRWSAPANDDKHHRDGRVARNAVAWLEEHRDGPFFLAVGFDSPHAPFIAPRKYFAFYPPYAVALPQEPPGHLEDVPEIALLYGATRQDMDDRERRMATAAYYACVSFIDAQVGLLMEALERLDLWRNTVVVLTSDHGSHLGEHQGLWRKGTLFEESLRVPLIVVAPGMPPGRVSKATVELVDLYPTLVELAQLPEPDGLQGRSLVPLLRDPSAQRKRPAYSVVRIQEGRMGRSLRTDRYRYTEWDGESVAQLYDLERDPREYRNLAADPRMARRVARVSRSLHRTARRAGAAGGK